LSKRGVNMRLGRLRALAPFRDPADNGVTLILGSGRSGTTWLTELAAAGTDGRIIFEPLHPKCVRGRMALPRRPYLPPDQPCSEMRPIFDPVFDGSLRSVWSDRYNDRFCYRHRLIKEIRANLCLGWIAKTYPQVRIALIVRNPINVAQSQMAGGWPVELSWLHAQPELLRDHPFLAAPELNRCDTQFKRNIAHWAVENRVALDQLECNVADRQRVRFFSYDTLKDDPLCLMEFLEFAGVANPARILGQASRPSRVTRPKVKDPRAGEAEKHMPTVSELDYAHGVLEQLHLIDFAQGDLSGSRK